MTAPLLRARSLNQRFDRRGRPVDALVDVDLDVQGGELVVIRGASLAGKTTLMDVLAGWTTPDSGVVEWSGSSAAPPWDQLAVVPQSFALIDELTVEENVLFAVRTGLVRPDRDMVDELMVRIGLEALRGRLADEVSVGERQRVMVARALVARPRLLLADEPVAHQDHEHALVVLDLIAEMAAAGAGCVVAARDDDVVEGFGDRAVHLHAGRVASA